MEKIDPNNVGFLFIMLFFSFMCFFCFILYMAE
jgi:hypothetical protein